MGDNLDLLLEGREGVVNQLELVYFLGYVNTFEFINNHYKLLKGEDIVYYNPFTNHWYRPVFYDETMLPCTD